MSIFAERIKFMGIFNAISRFLGLDAKTVKSFGTPMYRECVALKNPHCRIFCYDKEYKSLYEVEEGTPIENDCIYVEALNKRNAKRKLAKSYNIVLE